MATDPDTEAKQQRYLTTLAVIAAVSTACRADILDRVRLGHIFDALRPIWRERMQVNLLEQIHQTAADIGQRVAKRYGDQSFDPSAMDEYLAKVAENEAASWEQRVQDMLDRIDTQAADLVAEAEARTEAIDASLAELYAHKNSLTGANFAAVEAAAIEGKTHKTWGIQGSTTRPTHLAQGGLTIPIAETFPNGLVYPGSAGPPEETVNCDCFLTFS